MKKLTSVFSLIFLITVSFACATTLPPAFDGALGFGQYTKGGAGGKRFLITSLEDNPQSPVPGTLRYALKSKGPRIIEFAVSGVIHLKDELEIKHDFVSVLGQTSPGGIVITGAQTSIKANQVILRYLRFRPGHWQSEGDALTARNRHHVIIDHCSLSWANDEVASFYNNQWFTLQNSMITESLKNAGHHKGSHGYGGIWGGAKASFIRNVIAHHDSRNPRINGYRLKPQYPQSEALADIRNNVFFNWGDNSGYGGEGSRFNLVNNYYKPGPASEDIYFFEFWSDSQIPTTNAYVAGNVMAGHPLLGPGNGERAGVVLKNQKHLNASQVTGLFNDILVPEAFPTEPSDTVTAEEAYRLLIIEGDVGANENAQGAFRDSVDTRILQEISSGEPTFGSGLINSELTVLGAGGWPAYATEFTPGS